MDSNNQGHFCDATFTNINNKIELDSINIMQYKIDNLHVKQKERGASGCRTQSINSSKNGVQRGQT